jgi:hypothetical protein
MNAALTQCLSTKQDLERQSFEFLPSGRFYLDGITIHEAGRV